MHFDMVECSSCDLLYSHPSPSQDQISKLYECASYDSKEESECAARTYIHYFAKHISKDFSTNDFNLHNSKAKSEFHLLDVGCGHGAFLEEFTHFTETVNNPPTENLTDFTGIEPSHIAIGAASEKIKPHILQGVFKKDHFKPNSFDMISCFMTLEHIEDINSLVAEYYRVLKPGGLLYLVVHNRHGILNRILQESSPIFDIEHYQLFSPKSLNKLLNQNGFQNISCHSMVNTYPLKYWLRLLPISLKLKSILNTLCYPILKLKISIPLGNLAVFAYTPHEE